MEKNYFTYYHCIVTQSRAARHFICTRQIDPLRIHPSVQQHGVVIPVGHWIPDVDHEEYIRKNIEQCQFDSFTVKCVVSSEPVARSATLESSELSEVMQSFLP
jgi:hypothetical protein